MQNALDLLVSKLSSCTRYHLRSIDDDVQLFLKMNIKWKSKSRSNWREHTKTQNYTRQEGPANPKPKSKLASGAATRKQQIATCQSCGHVQWSHPVFPSVNFFDLVKVLVRLHVPTQALDRTKLSVSKMRIEILHSSVSHCLLTDFTESWDLTCMFTDCVSTEWQIATLYSRCTPSTTVQIYCN